jgi:hypothetical protein
MHYWFSVVVLACVSGWVVEGAKVTDGAACTAFSMAFDWLQGNFTFLVR